MPQPKPSVQEIGAEARIFSLGKMGLIDRKGVERTLRVTSQWDVTLEATPLEAGDIRDVYALAIATLISETARLLPVDEMITRACLLREHAIEYGGLVNTCNPKKQGNEPLIAMWSRLRSSKNSVLYGYYHLLRGPGLPLRHFICRDISSPEFGAEAIRHSDLPEGLRETARERYIELFMASYNRTVPRE